MTQKVFKNLRLTIVILLFAKAPREKVKMLLPLAHFTFVRPLNTGGSLGEIAGFPFLAKESVETCS